MSADVTAVVTVVHGRHEHLRTQRRHLAAGDPQPDRHVVVAIDDPAIDDVVGGQPNLPTTVVHVAATQAGLPVAAARNAGARAALAAGAEILVFLDVDCIPSPGLVVDYQGAVAARPDDISCGPVTYLPPTPAGGWTTALLTRHRAPHPARPDPPRGEVVRVGPALFWSLSFALAAATWRRLPGFYEGYVGYGGEDTDFGWCADDSGVRVMFFGGADAFHQHHAVSDPPFEHLDDIVRNSAVFRRRHGELPMRGWLEAFQRAGAITLAGGLPRSNCAVRVLTVPARHPYLDAVLPAGVDRVDVDRVVAWEPDPLLVPDAFAARQQRAERADVVHVHFSYEHLDPTQLQAWLAAVRAADVPLALTVHDLRNPHAVDPARHDAHLAMLLQQAERVFTLTVSAAQRCRRLVDRCVEVVPHPTLLADVPASRTRQPVVLVPLKAMRRNVRQAPELIAAVAAGAAAAGMRTRVLLNPGAQPSNDVTAVTRLAADGVIDLDTRPYLPEAELVDLVADVRALVLPYRWGTHSGWLELCRDVGTRVVAPDCGSFAEQWPEVVSYRNNEQDGLDASSLAGAVRSAGLHEAPPPADRNARLAERDLVRATHDALYRAVVRR